MTMLSQRWHMVVRLAYSWGWQYNFGPTLPLRHHSVIGSRMDI